jgi:aminopeptidase N
MNVVNNGTFFNNTYFPMIGYSKNGELSDDDERKKQGLQERPRALARNDVAGLNHNIFGDDADFINFDITLGTSPDQMAIAPGYLQKQWQANGKKYFHYVMDIPICNFYAIVSAKYVVEKQVYKGINLEIYHHPTHTYNIDRMQKAMKASLDYYQDNFGAYQYRQLRIMEVPRYHGFAQSFANTIPFGESMGFAMKIDDKKDIDMPFFVTAHEIAHQWWGHQVREADVKGAGLLSESLAEYSALMTMNKYSTKEQMQKFLQFELDYYLSGRAGERKNEQPLSTCENQQYVHYNKGSLVLYSIQDYIGERKLNLALKNYLQKWNWQAVNKTGIYANSNDLIKEIRAVTPDSLQYLVSDFIESITLYDNKITKAVAIKQKGQYQVNLTVNCEKIKADSLGNEKTMKMNEWLWIGVYSKPDKDEKEKLIYYQRHRINQATQQLSIFVKQQPYKAGIDPLNLLIDRHWKDNVVKID